MDARSIMGLMMLAAGMGPRSRSSPTVRMPSDALTAILALIEAKFGEE